MGLLYIGGLAFGGTTVYKRVAFGGTIVYKKVAFGGTTVYKRVGFWWDYCI